MINNGILLGVFWLFGFLTQAQHAMEPKKLSKLIPESLKGYKEDGESKASLIRVGTLQYSLCERKFSKGKEKIKILLFDYQDAPIMFKQATQRWSVETVISDSLVIRNIETVGCKGRESYHREFFTSQIFLGIHERFYLAVSAEHVALDDLRKIVSTVLIDKFPN